MAEISQEIDKQAWFKTIGYTPHSVEQTFYHNSNARFKIPCCGRRFGKSQMAATDIEPQLLQKDRLFWIVGPTYDLGSKEFKVLWNDLIVKRRLGLDKRVKKAFNKRAGEMYIEFPWHTRIEVRSATHPETLVGDGLHGVIMSEAAKHTEDTWERFIRPALADFRGWASFPSTPEGQNWYYELWKKGLDPNQPEYASWRFPSWINKILFPEGRQDPEILSLLQALGPDAFKQEIEADFTAFVGKIYDEFDEQIHVKQHTFRPEWRNYLFCDFGFVNPMAAIEVQISPRDEVYIWREHYKSHLTLDANIRMMKDRKQPYGYHLDLGFGDAADPEACLVLTEKLVPTWADPNSKTNWRAGVDLVKSFLALNEIDKDEFGTPIEAPRLFVDPSCVNTIREFTNYRSKAGTVNQGPAEIGKKIDDHALDAIRYGLYHIYALGGNSHLSDTEPLRYSNTPIGHKDSELEFVGASSSGYFTQGVKF